LEQIFNEKKSDQELAAGLEPKKSATYTVYLRDFTMAAPWGAKKMDNKTTREEARPLMLASGVSPAVKSLY
jgi:hypothetical protein